MFRSYYYLNRYSLELRQQLINKNILAAFSQDKEKLIIQLSNEPNLYLEMSVNPSEPFINLRDRFSRAKKNTMDFFPQLIGAVITDVLIASDDRIILISTNKGKLYFAIRGQFTNVFYFYNKVLESFKREDGENLTRFNNEFIEKNYLDHFNLIDKNLVAGKPIEEIRKLFPFVGREIENEVKLRSDIEKNNAESFIEVLKIIKDEKPVIYNDELSGAQHIGFDKLKIFSGLKKETFDNLIPAFNIFLSKKYFLEEKLSKHKKIRASLEKELKRITNKLSNLQMVIDKGSHADELNKTANLLLINLNLIKPGMSKVDIVDIYESGNMITVKLDQKLTPNQNAKKYFDKARDVRINFEKSLKLKIESQKYFEKLKGVELKFNISQTVIDLDLIMDELKIKNVKSETPKDDIGSKFKHYLIEKKYHVYVGKDSTNNDLLTTKFAKQNDFWFHARSVSGSHVILRVENVKEAVPKSILKKVASLAAYHSKSKTFGLASVSYTLKKYVSKRKGMPVGQVSLTKEDVLLVKPEIPSDCEFLVSE